MTVSVEAQLTTPLHVGTTDPILDEFGAPLKGSAEAPGDLVQILWASNGVINAPLPDGTPHTANPPVEGAEAAIGSCTAPNLTDSGLFAVSLVNGRPANNAQIFVRAFNAPTLEAASFYGDSQVLTVQDNNILDARIAGTTTPLDTGDDDLDGLHNSWEKSYGSDSSLSDSDADGMSDYHEHVAGTGPTDPDSLLVIAAIESISDEGILISWQSVPGKQYRVEYGTGMSRRGSPFTDSAQVVTAASHETEFLISNAGLEEQGTFRVLLVEP